MPNITKKILSVFLISGLVYASLMAGSDYSQDLEFRFWKFILSFLVFGSLMSLLVFFDFKRKKRNNTRQKND